MAEKRRQRPAFASESIDSRLAADQFELFQLLGVAKDLLTIRHAAAFFAEMGRIRFTLGERLAIRLPAHFEVTE